MKGKHAMSSRRDKEDKPKKVKKTSVDESKKNKKKKKKKHTFLKIILILLLLIAILGGVIVGYLYSKVGLMETVNIDKNQIEVNEGVDTKGYRNIVLYGVDSRENSYDNTLSDSIMIVSINQDTKQVRIASVYRDSYLKIGNSFDKITHAYGKGGPTLSMSTLNKNLDLNLTEFVAVNFGAVIDVVDEIGGIDLEITSEETKYINKYIGQLNKQNGKNSANITKAGKHHVDGVQALAYSRIRYTSGGDYKRTERQRTVLNEVFKKVKKMNVVELNDLANTILPEISTNISTTDIFGLLSQVAAYEIDDTTGWPFDIRGYQPGKAWYGAPVNLEKQVKELHNFLFEKEEYEVSATVKSISDELIKTTGYK